MDWGTTTVNVPKCRVFVTAYPLMILHVARAQNLCSLILLIHLIALTLNNSYTLLVSWVASIHLKGI